jgi:hypothetical protein
VAEVYPRGSEWRRWDPHLHAPGTALNDGFDTGWDGYIKAVEDAGVSVAALGITDYASIRTYKAFKAHRDAGQMKNILFAFPNIEFRITPLTKEGKGINIHLLIDSKDPKHVVWIDEALQRLSISRYKQNISCTEAGLTLLGSLHNSQLANAEDAAYREGVNQFKVDFEVFRDWYRKETWLSSNSLVALAPGSNDGASGLIDSGYLSTRRDIYAFSNIIFSGNPTERDAWLGKGSIKPEEFPQLGGHKPTIHGCDAHQLVDVFNPKEKRFCWIKADPTFEGLRQVMYEPEDRVWIGETCPGTHETRSAIDAVTVSNSSGWFEDDRSIPLNSGMVTIIGLKGSGKTAFADFLAFACGQPIDPENSFISRAGEHISALQMLLQWTDGSAEAASVPDSPGGGLGQSVRYLSQKFVDRLCSGDTLSTELQQEVESVIFHHLSVDDQMGCDDFAELRQFRTDGIRESRTDLRVQVQARSQHISELEERRAAILTKSTRRAQLPQLIAHLLQGLPKVDDQATSAKLVELEKLRQRLAKATQSVGTAKQSKQLVLDIERKISSKIQDVAVFWSAIASSLKQLGFTDSDVATLAPSWKAHPEVFRGRAAMIDGLIKALEGGTTATPGADSVAVLSAAITKAEADLKLDKAKKDKVLAIQKEHQKLLEEKRKLDAEFNWVEKNYKAERQDAQQLRMDGYLSYFDLLKEERDVLEELYAPLRKTLGSHGTQERKLDVVCRVEVDSGAWIARGAELFDLRKTGTFRYDQIEEIASKELTKAWLSCDKAAIRISLEKCVSLIKESDVLRSQLRSVFKPSDVAEWLFSVDHIDVSHGIQYENKDLRLLSPGTKGIVLLILYLAVDRFDNRPLIVDQPDENLDNQSTYEILRGYFREAKKRRQIIIITHNPNLVVNTDAEQVIVAESSLRSNGLPTISYSYGSLESIVADGPLQSTIREAVCLIMEGGKDAFRNRENRYGAVLEN